MMTATMKRTVPKKAKSLPLMKKWGWALPLGICGIALAMSGLAVHSNAPLRVSASQHRRSGASHQTDGTAIAKRTLKDYSSLLGSRLFADLTKAGSETGLLAVNGSLSPLSGCRYVGRVEIDRVSFALVGVDDAYGYYRAGEVLNGHLIKAIQEKALVMDSNDGKTFQLPLTSDATATTVSTKESSQASASTQSSASSNSASRTAGSSGSNSSSSNQGMNGAAQNANSDASSPNNANDSGGSPPSFNFSPQAGGGPGGGGPGGGGPGGGGPGGGGPGGGMAPPSF